MRATAVGTSLTDAAVPRFFPSSAFGRRMLLVGLCVLLGMTVLLLQTSIVASTGYDVDQLSKMKESQEHQNQEMAAQVASLRSLDRIEKEARGRLKMVTPTSYLYVTVDAMPAQPSTLLAKSLEADRPVAPPPANWWQNIPLVRQVLGGTS